MKKTTKIGLMLLASVIALVSVFCITSFATETEETLDVSLIKNIAVTDKIQAMYAVKADGNITAENAKLTVYDEDNNVVWSDYGVAENLTQYGGESYIVFYTNRIALFEMANFYYVQLEANGAKSTVETYSVAEYLFDRLYKDGFVNKTEADDKDYTRKKFYESLMATGATAYEIITNTAEKSIDDLAYVYVKGATLADGSSKAIVDKGNSVELSALPAGYVWEVTSYIGGVVETVETKDSTLTLDGNKVVALKSLTYYADSSYPASYKYSYDGLASEIYRGESPLITSDSESGRVSVENDALSVYNRSFGLVNGGEKTGATYVFETDLYMDSDAVTATNQTIGWFGMSAGASTKTAHFASFAIMYKATEGNITRLYISDSASGNIVYADLEIDAWQNIRIEYTPNSDNTGTVRFYLNGELTKEYVTKGYGGNAENANTSFECFGIASRYETNNGGYSGCIRLDNTFMSAISK